MSYPSVSRQLARTRDALLESHARIARSQFAIQCMLHSLAANHSGAAEWLERLDGLDRRDDAALLCNIASERVRVMGWEAIGYFERREEIAVGIGDVETAQTWAELADAAAGMLLRPN